MCERPGRLLLSCWTLLCMLVLGATPAWGARPVKERDVIIQYKSHPRVADENHVRNRGGKVKRRLWLVPAVAARVPESALAELALNANVLAIEPDVEVSINDQELDNVWGVARIGGGDAHNGGHTGTDVRVAVLDTGIDYTHPELAACVAGGWDFVNNDADPMDDHGHGTHIAGTIAAPDDGYGVVGLAPGAELYALKVLGANGSGSFSSVLAAIQWCIENGIQVTNNSYGSAGHPGSIVEQAFANATAAGIVMVAAAGNSGNSAGTGDNVNYPARFPSVIAVAATTSSDVRASFSCTGPDLELAAPGQAIYSTLRGGGYGTMSGTSMACPHVVGAAAVLVGAGVTDVADVRFLLAMSSVDLGPAGVDSLYGYGLIDVAVALTTVDGPPPVDPPPPPDDDPPPLPEDDPPPPTLASVDWIDYAPYGGKKNNVSLSVAVALIDENGAPLADALVTVRINRGRKLAYAGDAVTDSNGLAIFNIVKAGKGRYVTTVLDVFAAEYEWDGVTPENLYVK